MWTRRVFIEYLYIPNPPRPQAPLDRGFFGSGTWQAQLRASPPKAPATCLQVASCNCWPWFVSWTCSNGFGPKLRGAWSPVAFGRRRCGLAGRQGRCTACTCLVSFLQIRAFVSKFGLQGKVGPNTRLESSLGESVGDPSGTHQSSSAIPSSRLELDIGEKWQESILHDPHIVEEFSQHRT